MGELEALVPVVPSKERSAGLEPAYTQLLPPG